MPPTTVISPPTPSRCGVIEYGEGALGFAALRGAALFVQRPDARPGPQRAHLAEAGHHLLALFQQLAHFPALDAGVVRVGHVDRGRADDGHGADRHQDVAVAGRVAAVDDGVDEAVGHRDHRALAGAHGDRAAGHAGDLPGPRARGVDDQRGGQVALVARAPVAHGCAGHLAARDRQADDLVVGEHRAALGLDGRAERSQHVEGVGRGIRDAEGAGDGRVERRLFLEHLRDADLRGLDVAFAAGVDPLVRVGRVVVGGRDEEAAGVLDGVRHDPAQDAVLLDALARRFRVAHGVASARMQQPVVAARRAVGQIGPLDQRHPQPAQRQVERGPAARRAAADDDDVVVLGSLRPS